jgi:SAM-dependent methyltransferase
VYELDKPITRPYRDVAYYTESLRGTPGRVLELACGTGRFLVPLLGAGLAVDGLDHSADMLDVCRRHCAERGFAPHLQTADMADFSVPLTYDVVLIGSGSIKELAGREAVLGALRSTRRCLRPGGLLYADLVPPRHVSGARSPAHPTDPGPLRYWRRDDDLWTLQPVHVEYDSAENRTTQLLRYEKWHQGALVAAELHQFVVQHWTLWEFGALLAEAGFREFDVTADYCPGRPPRAADDDWTFRAVAG